MSDGMQSRACLQAPATLFMLAAKPNIMPLMMVATQPGPAAHSCHCTFRNSSCWACLRRTLVGIERRAAAAGLPQPWEYVLLLLDPGVATAQLIGALR